MTRRTFLKQTFLFSNIIIFFNGRLYGQANVSTDLSLLLDDLFPKINNISLINPHYFDLIMKHPKVLKATKQTILKAIKQLNTTSVENYQKLYKNLKSHQREELIQDIAKTKLGDKWLYLVMTFILESAFGDPIYGGNPKEISWKLARHVSGNPRPKVAYI